MKVYPLGVGLGNWQIYANKYDATHLLKHQYPHNLILEIFVELGFITGALFIILLLKVLFLVIIECSNIIIKKTHFIRCYFI